MNRKSVEAARIMCWLLAGIILVWIIVGPAHATDNKPLPPKHHDSTAIADSTLVNRDSSSAIGIGGSDYDIGRGSCRFHEGGLTVAWSRADKFCQGIDMIRLGMVEGGIRHLCEQTDLKKNYDDFESCQDELRQIHAPTVEPVGEITTTDDEDKHREQQMELDDLMAKVASIEAKSSESEFRRRAARAQAILKESKQ